jgi:two-component system phosphate regulon sensor histidine kinase PhoR
VDDYRGAAEAKHIKMQAEAEGDGRADCRVRADREGLREILDNLLDNAIKYTPEGGSITVTWNTNGARSEARGARRDERGAKIEENNSHSPAPSPQPPTVRIAVRDSGIGIKPEDQERIFERFYRVDRARSRELGGTGLGLSIVKHLAQSMDGAVAVESEMGKGSVFTVELPLG